MGDITNLIQREIRRAMNTHAQPRAGLVTSYDEKAHAVKVKLMPEGKETGWIPVGSMQVGNGFGIAIGPNIDDQFMVGFHEGDINSPFIMARMFSDKDKAPEVKAGEITIMHKSKSALHFDKDGQIKIAHSKGGSLLWDKDGHVNIDNGDRKIALKGKIAINA